MQKEKNVQVNLKNERKLSVKILECSSRGDKRFSAFYANVNIKNRVNSIEYWYQNAKRTEDGKVPGKGKKVAYFINPFTYHRLPASELTNYYYTLWIRYFTQNPELLEYAKGFDTFTDMFRGKCINCQADVIAECVKDFEAVKEKIKTTAFYADCLKRNTITGVNK